MKTSYRLALTLFCALLAGCATTSDPAKKYAGQSAQQIFTGGEQALAKGNYNTAVSHYEGLDALYPFSEYSEQALLDSIYAYYQADDPASAAAAAQRYIHTYPASPYVDYAYYMQGVSEMIQDRTWTQRYLPLDVSARDPGASRKAYDDLAQLIQLYPNSVYAPDARQRMIYLRNSFAQQELEIANFYYMRHAYIAAANRASYILEHFNGTPAVEPALGLMVQSYRALGETDEANKTLQVLQLNYPNSPVLQQLAENKP